MEPFIEILDSFIERIKNRQPQVETVEWYLLNNLRQLKEAFEISRSQREYENAVRILSRFSIDSMDWDDPLFKETSAILEEARRLIK